MQDIVLSELTSLDGKPLDFSFKNLKNLNGKLSLTRPEIHWGAAGEAQTAVSQPGGKPTGAERSKNDLWKQKEQVQDHEQKELLNHKDEHLDEQQDNLED